MLTPSDSNTNKIIKPYNMKRGKPNVILFVGLQGAGKTTSIAKYCNKCLKRRVFSWSQKKSYRGLTVEAVNTIDGLKI